MLATLAAFFLNATGAVADSTRLYVSLITCDPGSEVYELEGHSGIRIIENDHDVIANWGLFDFDAPNFVYRFVKGETDYSLGLIPTDRFIYSYARQGRRITEQPLALTRQEARRLIDAINENARPENRIYRYNYVKDNCATRPLKLIEMAVAPDSLILSTPFPETATPPATIRQSMTRYHAAYPWYQFGIDLALGSGIDTPASDRDMTYAPATLRQMLTGATVGQHRLLTSDPVTILPPSPSGGPLAPTPWYLSPTFTLWLLCLLSAAISIRNIRNLRISRWFDSIFYTLLGIAGLILTFLVFISTHEATSPNWLLLWINPLCLIVPISLWCRRIRKVGAMFHLLNIAGIVTFAAIWCAGIQQGNQAFIPLMLADIMRAVVFLYTYRNVK